MKKIFLVTISFLFLIPISLAQVYDFSVWAEGPMLFTTGKPEIVNIYVRNTGDVNDSYTITPFKLVSIPPNPELLQIYLPSDKINLVYPNRTSSTFATVTLLGPVQSAEIWFDITSEATGNTETTNTVTNIKSGYPISLPEFGLFGLLLLLLLSALIISYSFHFRQSFFNVS